VLRCFPSHDAVAHAPQYRISTSRLAPAASLSVRQFNLSFIVPPAPEYILPASPSPSQRTPAISAVMSPHTHCTNSITLACPIEGTVYGYYPSLAWNAIYVAIFTACCIAQIVLGIRYKVKTYSIVVSLGCFAEVVGMHDTLATA
jgi:hypothetical protein